MQDESPFSTLIVQKDVYILLRMIRYLRPIELRNFGASCKTVFNILGNDIRFIRKAYISAFRGYTVDRHPVQRQLDLRSPTETVIRRLAEFLILHKDGPPVERFRLARVFMHYSSRAAEASKARKKYYRVGEIVNTAISGKLYKVLETLRNVEERLETLQNEDSPHLRYRSKFTHLREVIKIVREMTKKHLQEYWNGYRIINNTIRYDWPKRNIRREKRKIKKIIANKLALIDYLLPAIIREITKITNDKEIEIIQERDRVEQSKPTNEFIKILSHNTKTTSKILNSLRPRDIRSLRATCKKTEWTIISSNIGVHKALYKPLAGSFKRESRGETYTNLLAWLVKGSITKRDKYMCLRRLINARLEEKRESALIVQSGRVPNLIKTLLDFSTNIRGAVNVRNQYNTSWTGRIKQISDLKQYIFGVWKNTVGYEDEKWKAKMKKKDLEKLTHFATK